METIPRSSRKKPSWRGLPFCRRGNGPSKPPLFPRKGNPSSFKEWMASWRPPSIRFAYFPELGQEQKHRLRDEFLAKAKNGGEDVARESFSVEKYLDFVDSDEYRVRPIYSKGEWHSGAKEETR